jgi:serine protease inhibitor
MAKRAVNNQEQEQQFGDYLKPEVKNIIKLTLAFAKAVGQGQSDKGENLVVSPYNAAACLGMVALGADGQTREELAKTFFGTNGAGLEQGVKDYAKLNDEILAANKGQVTLSTANGIWTNKDNVTLLQSFADDARKNFGAEISAEDYGDPATVKKINDWADKNTNGLIKEVLKNLSGDDAAVLASSLYFKGQWTNKFDKALTEDKGFTQDGGAVSKTPTMRQDIEEDMMKYVKGKDFEAVALTYGEKKRTDEEWKDPTMRIVLVRPTDDNVSARDWLASQANGKVPQWLDAWQFREAVGSVELPRIDIKQKHDLIPALQDMGVRQAFDETAANFKKMIEPAGRNLFISKVSHDVVFKTNEEGSEAAAVTVAVASFECVAAAPQIVNMKLDRSFVFALQDVKTGAVLFMGAVNKPSDDMTPGAKKSGPDCLYPPKR